VMIDKKSGLCSSRSFSVFRKVCLYSSDMGGVLEV
jgi:hypothetical protein